MTVKEKEIKMQKEEKFNVDTTYEKVKLKQLEL